MSIFILSIFLFIICFVSKSVISSSIISTTNLTIFILFPSLFLMIIITKLLDQNKVTIWLTNKIHPLLRYLFGFESVNESYIFLFSFLCGNPTLAIMSNDLINRKMMSRKEGERLVSCLSFSSFTFLYNSICHMPKKAIISIILATYIPPLFSLIRLNKTNSTNQTLTNNLQNNKSLFEAINDSFTTVIKVSSIILFFTIICNAIFELFNLHIYLKFLIANILEVTVGSLIFLDISNSMNLFLFIFFNTFLGLSIHLQIYSVFKLNYLKFLSKRIFLSLICSIYGLLIYKSYLFILIIFLYLPIKKGIKLSLNNRFFRQNLITDKINN